MIDKESQGESNCDDKKNTSYLNSLVEDDYEESRVVP